MLRCVPSESLGGDALETAVELLEQAAAVSAESIVCQVVMGEGDRWPSALVQFKVEADTQKFMGGSGTLLDVMDEDRQGVNVRKPIRLSVVAVGSEEEARLLAPPPAADLSGTRDRIGKSSLRSARWGWFGGVSASSAAIVMGVGWERRKRLAGPPVYLAPHCPRPSPPPQLPPRGTAGDGRGQVDLRITLLNYRTLSPHLVSSLPTLALKVQNGSCHACGTTPEGVMLRRMCMCTAPG